MNNQTDKAAFGKRIRKYRNRLHMSQGGLAFALDVKFSRVSAFESGTSLPKRHVPMIRRALGMDTARADRDEDSPTLAERLDVYRYTDYTRFLKAWFGYLKEINPELSFAQLATRLGFGSETSTAYLSEVFKGHEAPSEHAIWRIRHAIGLKGARGEYLKLMLLLSRGPLPRYMDVRILNKFRPRRYSKK